jgi:tetratricopeptide (TPR) repeat protein
MTTDEKVAELFAESKTLTPETDKPRLLSLYSAIASLIDRNAKPKKWAAFRMMFGQLAYPADLPGALEAFRDAAPHWDRVGDHDAWAECKSYIGWCLFLLGRIQPPENEEAIECLESSLNEFPDGTPEMLAFLYQHHVQGDRWENWKKQIDYLQLAQSQAPVAADPVHWAKLENEIALALTREPQGDFEQAVEQRIARHEAALNALQPILSNPNANPELIQAARNRAIVNYESISEAYMCRVKGDITKNRETAAAYARLGWQSCDDTTPRETRVTAASVCPHPLAEDVRHSPSSRVRRLWSCRYLAFP